MTAPQPESSAPLSPKATWRGRVVIIVACIVAVGAAITVSVVKSHGSPGQRALPANSTHIGTFSHHPVVITLPIRTASYLGAFAKGVPESYTPIQSFIKNTGVHPNVALYYSGWYEKFQSAFAIQVANHGAIPFIQINPSGVSFAAIIAGAYDSYLETFATDVASYGAETHHGVIIGFAHEMNGQWFPWGYRHLAPATFVAAWQHIVNVFRQQGADDVTWLWTINIIDQRGGIASPGPWWPGSSYVTWVGIDGYYYKPSWRFAPLFGPTIKAVRALTLDPIIIAETGVAPAAGQPPKIADLFAGIHGYGLLGFVWFDAKHIEDWRITTPAAIAAFRRGVKTFDKAPS